jgi:hypothetical protein
MPLVIASKPSMAAMLQVLLRNIYDLQYDWICTPRN